MEKAKILIVHNHYQISGGEDSVVANEQQLLENHGHKVRLYSRDNAELKQLSVFRKLALPFTSVFNPKTYMEVKRIIRREHIDIVHVHNTLNLISPSVYYAALKCDVPVLQTIHNFRLLCPNALFYRDGHICEDCVEHGLGCAIKHNCYRGSRMQTLACVITAKIHRMTGIYGKLNYICLTQFNKDKLLSLKQIDPEKVYVKPNFTVCANDMPSADRSENPFIFAGRLEKTKGLDIMLAAWKLLGSSAPKLVICGTGPMEAWCQNYITCNNLKNVELKGYLPNQEVIRLVAGSRALILPTQCYEGFPMSIVEAFSVGTPVICSDLGNAGNLVEEGITGCKFNADFPEELAEAILRINQYKEIHKTTKERYLLQYTEEKNYERLSEIYDLIRGSKMRLTDIDAAGH